MKGKTLSIIAGAALLFATAVPAASMPVWAAKGGAVRMAAPKTAPPAAAPKSTPNGSGAGTQRTANPNQTQQARPNTNTTAQNAARTNQSSSRWGSAMRNIGLLAGGMFLGSMLSSLFGWGNMGFMADILGVLFNIILLLVIISIYCCWLLFLSSAVCGENSGDGRAAVKTMPTAAAMKQPCETNARKTAIRRLMSRRWMKTNIKKDKILETVTMGSRSYSFDFIKEFWQ